MSECSSNLARFDGLRYGFRNDDDKMSIIESYSKTRREGFGPEVRRRIILGTYALSAGFYDMFYIKALKVRTLIKEDFLKALQTCNLLVGPTMPSGAFKIDPSWTIRYRCTSKTCSPSPSTLPECPRSLCRVDLMPRVCPSGCRLWGGTTMKLRS